MQPVDNFHFVLCIILSDTPPFHSRQPPGHPAHTHHLAPSQDEAAPAASSIAFLPRHLPEHSRPAFHNRLESHQIPQPRRRSDVHRPEQHAVLTRNLSETPLTENMWSHCFVQDSALVARSRVSPRRRGGAGLGAAGGEGLALRVGVGRLERRRRGPPWRRGSRFALDFRAHNFKYMVALF